VTPAVSVIIAALHAHEFLGEALDSVLAQSFPDFEIVVAPDEAADYSMFAVRDRRIRILPGVETSTGPGPARNRAMAAARGDWVALLDADDLWSENYLAILLPLAQAHGASNPDILGAAFGRTVLEAMRRTPIDIENAVTLENRDFVIRAIPPNGVSGDASFGWFDRAYASFHGIARRISAGHARNWRNIFAEDVLFDLETLGLAGGKAPFSGQAVYRLRLRDASTTQTDLFIRGIADEYDAIIQMIRRGETDIPIRFRKAAGQVFASWKRMNARYLEARKHSELLRYQNFISSLLA
jgi:glycosyltransferase involved in cell wall biosynthesis